MKTILIIFMYCLALSNCIPAIQENNQNSGNTSNPIEIGKTLYRPRETEKPEVVLIYCDLTTSIKQEGILKISEKLKQVLLNVPRNSTITIRLVEKNLLGESIYPEIKTPADCEIPDTTVNRKRRDALEACNKNDNEYVRSIEEISEKIRTLKPQEDVSCIIDTLETAHDFFKGKDGDKYKFRLVYFSDMIEQCYGTSIFVCSSKRQPVFKDIMTRIENNFNPNYNLNALIKNDLSVIVTTSDNPNDKCLTLSEKKQVWELVFKKLGYSNLDLSVFNFTQEIPEKLKR